MQFCSRCGQQMDDQQRFCPSCGQPVQPASGQAPMYAVPVQPVVYAVKPKIPGRGFGISSMVLGIIGLVYAVGLLFTAIDLSNSANDSFFGYLYLDKRIESITVTAVMCAILSVLALIFGGCAAGRKYKNGVSTSGIVMGVVGLVLYIAAIATVQSI